MIPKTIHYCWFGENPKPELASRCIESWKKYCSDYEIKEWNESNFDISSAPLYVRQAYEAKKWAFVTDFVRLRVVYENGGLYFDTDVELLRNPDFLLNNAAFFGFGDDNQYINTGLGFGARKEHPMLKQMMDDYQLIPFVQEDGTYDQFPCPMRNTQAFLVCGLKQDGSEQVLPNGVHILPSDYFCPLEYSTGKLKKTVNTVSVHWFDSSWQDEESKQSHKRLQRYQRFFGKMMGDRLFGITECIRREGFVGYIKKRWNLQ